jgi:ketosteroid isomerase-like protein
MPPNAIEAVVGWMDAMRRGDLDGAAGWFHPDVTWKGVPDDAVCRNRDDVVAMLRDSLTPCPDAPGHTASRLLRITRCARRHSRRPARRHQTGAST